MPKKYIVLSIYDIPIYTVMDEPTIYNHVDDISCGFYFVDKPNSYFPLRGNGWYSQPMIAYCFANKIIKKTDITHQLLPSLFLSSGYFKNYIDSVYKHVDDTDTDLNTLIKLVINSFIGS